MAKYLRSVPYFMKAKTTEELVEKMLKNNLENNQVFQYENIMHDGKDFIVWFAVPMDEVVKALKINISAKDKIANKAVNTNKTKIK